MGTSLHFFVDYQDYNIPQLGVSAVNISLNEVNVIISS